MPKASSITKEMIIDAAFEIVRANGFAALSARNIAKKTGCSTQPIFWIFENMEVLKQEVISKMLCFLSSQTGSCTKTGKPFLDLGLGYVRVAFTEPVLFKALYIDNVLGIKLTDLIPSEMMITAMKNDAEAADISEEKQNDVAVKSWIFAHGLASLIATGMMVYDEEKIEKMLLSIFLE